MDVYNSSFSAQDLENAIKAVPSIGENGNWWIGDTDTGVFAGGVDVSGAEAGQIIQISEVDENGRPISWEPVDGVEREWILIADVTTTEEVQTLDFTTDVNGNPFEVYSDVVLSAKFLPNTEAKGSTYNNLKGFIIGGNQYGYGFPRHQSAGVPTSGQRQLYTVYRYSPITNEFNPLEMATHTISGAVYSQSYYDAAGPGAISTEKRIPITRFNFNAYALMGVGSQVRIYGR